MGGLVTLLGFVNQFTSVFHDVAWQYTEIVQYNTDVQTARSIGEDYANNHRAEATITLPQNWQTISIDKLSFSHRDTYDEGHAPQSLHDISIKIQRGKKIAFIGESGSGKSTLLALLRGLYEPETNIKFEVDGKPFQMATLNETVTLFPQEPEIFENTICYNITLGLPFEEADVWKVCEEARYCQKSSKRTGIKYSRKRCESFRWTKATIGIGSWNFGCSNQRSSANGRTNE